uniref:BAG domain-containing protein n=1 Tax=Anopheles atroparvus TaxID=41427 RepID=A0A182JH38_ANOAO
MSSQQEQPQQPTVRHIPIFVEGRSEPLVNTSPESQPSQPTQHHPSGLDSPGMEMPNKNDFFKHGSIFDRARDIPVRTFANSNFMSKTPGFKREPSPGASRSPFTDMPAQMRQEPPPSNANVPRGSSVPRQTPSPPTAQSANQPSSGNAQYQQQRKTSQQQQQQEQPQPVGHDQPDCRPKASVKEDPITKIQKIQKDVLAIFDQVEHFKGGKEGKKDKTYIYLDEMLTQNLLKLDSIDAEDQPQIKSARREAIKSINTCITVLEAKAEAGATESANASSTSISKNNSSNGIDGTNGPEHSTANRSASNASIPHSSNSSQQLQSNEGSKQQ